MVSKPLSVDKLKRIMLENIRKLDKDKYARKCIHQLQTYKPVFKDIELSQRAKSEANRLYGQKGLNFAQLYKILSLYNYSIAFAPQDSEELATIYANKSAVLLRMRKYKECISEVDNALKTTESITLKVKMLCRKAECLTALGSSENRNCLKKAKFIITKLEDTEKEKLVLDKLIEKAQRLISNDELDIPKEDKRKTQALKMVAEAEKLDLWESIRVEYSKIYGRHLVSACDFDPGEIIIVEKSYSNHVSYSRIYQYCCYCFNHLWTAVPCDHCSRRLYCSEKCKIAAWNEHHEMDCFAVSCMHIPIESGWDWYIAHVLTIFCKALREAGSIEQLVADWESLNQYKDGCCNDIFLSKDFMSYKNLFTMPICDFDKEDVKYCINCSIGALIVLAKYTKILGKSYDFGEMNKLAKDDTAILVGALLLRFSVIIMSGGPGVNLIDPNDHMQCSKDSATSYEGPRNVSLTFLMHHTLFGCIPNVEVIRTHENKFILCAIRPIKPGDQLVVSSKSDSILAKSPKFKRQLQYNIQYGCPCECQACTEDWSDVFEDPVKDNELSRREAANPAFRELIVVTESLRLDWKNNCLKPSFPDIKMLDKAISIAETAWEEYSMPSIVITRAALILVKVLRAFYCPSEIYAKVPNLRQQNL